MQAGLHQAKNRLAAQHGVPIRPGFKRLCHRYVRLGRDQRVQQAPGEIQREQRTVARYRQQQRAAAKRQAGLKARKGTGEILHPVRKNLRLACTKAGLGLRKIQLVITVGIDQYAMQRATILVRKANKRMLHQRLAAKRLQPLVHPPHASAPPAGEDQRGDVVYPDIRCRSKCR